MSNHYTEAERLLDRAHHYSYGDGADPQTGASLASEGTGYALLAIADRLDALLALQKPAAEREQPAAEPEWTETQTTYAIVADAITEYIADRATVTDLPIDIRVTAVQVHLAECIVQALVGDEGEQPETAKFPDVATSTSHDHRDREAVIGDALYEATGDADNASSLAAIADDALVSAGYSTSPVAARLASMVAPCQLVMAVLVQYGIHDDGPYGDQGRMNIAIAVAGALVGTNVDDVDVRVDRTRAAVAATYGGYCELQEIAESIVRALAGGRTT